MSITLGIDRAKLKRELTLVRTEMNLLASMWQSDERVRNASKDGNSIAIERMIVLQEREAELLSELN